MAREDYEAQVALLMRLLPHVAKEKVFALKGGTAINLFYRDLPRLSVDIDLTYLPIKDRGESLAEINEAMDRMAAAIEGSIAGAKTQRIQGGGGGATRVLARLGGAEIKIETSPVMRGVVHDPEMRPVSDAVADEFGYAEMQVVSFEDLFGGKLHAAVDRQHPRDLYDIKLLYENEGLTEDLFRTFLIYIACSSRPAHELLDPNFIDLDEPYTKEFEGMTKVRANLDDLLETRERLVADIRSRLDEKVRTFLLRLHDGTPDFGVIERLRAADLLYALFFGLSPFPGAAEAFANLLSTPRGWALVMVGSGIGALFAAFAFAISLFSIPMMLERRVDALTAMGRSFAMTLQNLPVVLVWGVIVAAGLVLCVATGFLALIVIFPVLGHGTWHVWRAISGGGES